VIFGVKSVGIFPQYIGKLGKKPPKKPPKCQKYSLNKYFNERGSV